MKKAYASAIFVCVFVLTVAAQEGQDNPFRKAKVGDFVGYKVTTSVMGKSIDVEMKQVVSAKTDKEATLTTTATVMGMQAPPRDTKIDLTKEYDPIAAATQAKGKGTFEKTGTGKEKLSVNGKNYDCEWIKGKVVADAGGKKLESDVQIWFSKALPLTGMVKMSMKSNFLEMTMEATDFGSEK